MKKNVTVLCADETSHIIYQAILDMAQVLELPLDFTFAPIETSINLEEELIFCADSMEKIEQADALLWAGRAPISITPCHNAQFLAALRQKLGLYAHICPTHYIEGDLMPFRNSILYENSEMLHKRPDLKNIQGDIAHWLRNLYGDIIGLEEAHWTGQVQTRFGLERIVKKAFSYAQFYPNLPIYFVEMPKSLGGNEAFARDIFAEIAEKFPHIPTKIIVLDKLLPRLLHAPHEFGILVTSSILGPLLARFSREIMGSAALATGIDLGDRYACFYPVWEDVSFKDKDHINPAALFYSLALLLKHVGFSPLGEKIEKATDRILRAKEIVTPDRGGQASTGQMTEAIIREIMLMGGVKQASVLTIGDELLCGQYVNSNQQAISLRLNEAGYTVKLQATCADDWQQISAFTKARIGQDDLIVVCGGLGPTKDDKTREAVAHALGKTLRHDEETWHIIQQQIAALGIKNDPSNRLQALFPEDATILPNPSGTAPGFISHLHDSQIIVLPGPPSQALPMLDTALSLDTDKTQNKKREKQQKLSWTLIGISEGEVGSIVNELVGSTLCDVHFLWKSPYVLVDIEGKTQEDLSKLEIALNQAFAPYLVSKNHDTARAILYRDHGVVWHGEDEDLIDLLAQKNRSKQKNKLLSVVIQISPSLQEVQAQEAYLGQMHMCLYVQECAQKNECGELAKEIETKKYEIRFPFNKILLEDCVPEYAAWGVLKILAQEKNIQSEENSA